jgi:hypothetical protein
MMRKQGVSYLAVWLAATAMACGTCVLRASPEILASGDIHRINEAESQFHSTRGRYGNLLELGPDGANLITAELAKGLHHSYRFSLSAETASYVLRARPLRWEEGAMRSFYADQTGIVRQNWTNNEATAESERVN